MTAKEILAELKKLGSASTKKTLMKNHGMKEPFFGVKIGDMKKIQKRIKKDYHLVLDLYDTGNYDAMYLAGLIADDARMTKKDLRCWVKNATAARCRVPPWPGSPPAVRTGRIWPGSGSSPRSPSWPRRVGLRGAAWWPSRTTRSSICPS